MRSKEAIVTFLTIIVATTVFVGYQYFDSNTKTVNDNKQNNLSEEGDNAVAVVNAITINFDEPETFEEMKSDLIEVGCDTIIIFPVGWHGIRGLTYSDALKLAKKANWVGVSKDKEIGFIFYLDGSYWIWLKSTSQYTFFEKIEVTSAYCKSSTADWTGDLGADCWVITLDFRNTGTTEASFIGAFVNAKHIADYSFYSGGNDFVDDHMRAYDGSIAATNQLNFEEVSGHSNSMKLTVMSGSSGKIIIEIKKDAGSAYSFTSGTTIEVSLSTGAGNTYMKMVMLS